jgi:chitodextrinase
MSYTDTGLTPLTSYSYTVTAFDCSNNVSAPSGTLVASTAPPGPAFVQLEYATPQTPQSLVSVTYAGAETAGDTNIIAIGWSDTTSVITSMTDTAGPFV